MLDQKKLSAELSRNCTARMNNWRASCDEILKKGPRDSCWQQTARVGVLLLPASVSFEQFDPPCHQSKGHCLGLPVRHGHCLSDHKISGLMTLDLTAWVVMGWNGSLWMLRVAAWLLQVSEAWLYPVLLRWGNPRRPTVGHLRSLEVIFHLPALPLLTARPVVDLMTVATELTSLNTKTVPDFLDLTRAAQNLEHPTAEAVTAGCTDLWGILPDGHFAVTLSTVG